jgi:molybdopterin-biosynthesis enzyme MoeA-like protein
MKSFQPAVITVGDELILGERQNENERWMLQVFQEHHFPALISVILPDDVKMIANWIKRLKEDQYFPIFISGGLGGTHDDCTREGVAQGLGLKLERNEACYQELKAYYKDKLNEQRERMAWLPKGCDLISNPFGAPGFSLNGIFAFPGFPKMLQSMVPNVLSHIAGEKEPEKWQCEEISLPLSEGDIAIPVEQFSQTWPNVRLGIYANAKTNERIVTLRLRYLKNEPEALAAFQQMVHQFENIR